MPESRPEPCVALLAEDRPLQGQVADTLAANGFRVDAFSSAPALERGLSLHCFDALLVDAALADGDPLAVLEHSRTHVPHLAIIWIGDDPDGAADALELGAFDLLYKPLAPARTRLSARNAVQATRLATQIAALECDATAGTDAATFAGTSDAARRLRRGIGSVATWNTPVLIVGESGTGRADAARLIHDKSARASGPFAVMNCAALPPDEQALALFGGAGRQSALAQAQHGTLFVDEIADLVPDVQQRLLRTLEERFYLGEGSTDAIPTDVRIVAGGPPELVELVENGRFDETLYARLGARVLQIAPLRDRTEDLALLAPRIASDFASNGHVPRLHDRTLDALSEYDWPGNLRELRNALQHAVVVSRARTIEPRHLPEWLIDRAIAAADPNDALAPSTDDEFVPRSLADWEADAIRATLDFSNRNISRAAEILDVARSTLYRKLKEYDL